MLKGEAHRIKRERCIEPFLNRIQLEIKDREKEDGLKERQSEGVAAVSPGTGKTPDTDLPRDDTHIWPVRSIPQNRFRKQRYASRLGVDMFSDWIPPRTSVAVVHPHQKKRDNLKASDEACTCARRSSECLYPIFTGTMKKTVEEDRVDKACYWYARGCQSHRLCSSMSCVKVLRLNSEGWNVRETCSDAYSETLR